MKKYLDIGHYIQLGAILIIWIALVHTLFINYTLWADNNAKPKDLVWMIIKSYSDKLETQKQEIRWLKDYVKQLETKNANKDDLLNKCSKQFYIPN